jgi:hypothetical protein
LAWHKRQPQADARPTAGTIAAFEPAAVSDGVPGHNGQAEPEAARDLPEAWAGVLDREQRRVPLMADLNNHRAGWPCRACRIAQQVRDHATKQHRVDDSKNRLGHAYYPHLPSPGHALGGDNLANDLQQVGLAWSRPAWPGVM